MNQAQNPESRKSLPAWVPALIIFLLAAAARSVYLYLYHGSGYWDIMALDPETHDMLARRLARGMGLGERAYFRAPFYIYMLGAAYKLFGPGYLAPRLLQALLGSASACITYLAARRLLSGAAAFLVGVVASLYWAFIYFDGELLVDGPAVFFAMMTVLCLVSGIHTRPAGALATGILLGLGAVTRANFLLFAASVIVVNLIPKSGRKSAALILVGMIIPIVPITARNLAKAGDLVLISSQGGINFYMGNSPDADGRTPVVPIPRRKIPSAFLARFQADPWFREDVWLSSVYGAEQALGRPVKESRVSSYWYTSSLKWIIRHPIAWMKLMIKKTYFALHRTEVSNNRDLDYHLERIPFLKALAHLNFGIISPLFIMGFLLSLSKVRWIHLTQIRGEDKTSQAKLPGGGGWLWLDLFVVTYGLSVILFFVNSRYRLPVIPAAIILAGEAVSRMASWNRQRRYVALGASLAGFFFLLWLTNADLARWNDRPLRAAMHYNLGLAFSRAHRFEDAAREFQAAVGIKDDFPEAHLALGNALAVSGREREAVNEYHIAILQEPGLAEAHYNMALTFVRLNEKEKAKLHFEYAHALAPEIFPAPEKTQEENLAPE